MVFHFDEVHLAVTISLQVVCYCNYCISKCLIIYMYHCSPESNLVKMHVPETLTTDSESPWHGDSESGVG